MRLSVRLLVAVSLVHAHALHAQQALRVLQVLPEGELRPSSTLTITFDRPVSGTLEELVDPATIVRLTPALPARYEWRDPATIRIIPQEALRPGSSLSIEVDTTFVASDGSRLRQQFRRTLSVAGPALIGSSPALNTSSGPTLDPTGRVLLEFSGDVDASAMARTARFEPSAGRECRGRPSYPLKVLVRKPLARDPWELQSPRQGRDTVESRFDRVVELVPTERLPEGCALDLVIPLTENNRTEDVRYAVRSAAAFAVINVSCADSSDCAGSSHLTVNFNAPVSLADFQSRVHVRPSLTEAAKGTRPSAGWTLPLHMSARDSLTVVVDSGLTDTYGRTISGTLRFVVLAGDRMPLLAVPSGFETSSRDGTPTLRLRHLNVASVEVHVTRVPEAERFRVVMNLWQRLQAPSSKGLESVTFDEQLTEFPNEERSSVIPLRLPNEQWRHSLLVVRVTPRRLARAPDGGELRLDPKALADRMQWYSRPQPIVVQYTNLMAQVKLGVAGGAAFVTDIRTGRPVANAQVRVFQGADASASSGVSSADGVALLKASKTRYEPSDASGADNEIDRVPQADAAYPFARQTAVEVTLGSDRSITLLTSTWRWGRAYRPNNHAQVKSTRTVIHTDRGIYRPGEMVYFSSIVRDGWLDSLRAPQAGESVRWRVYFRDPAEGSVVMLRDKLVRLSSYGTTSDSVRLSPRARLGNYVIRLERKQYGRWTVAREASVAVAEYRAPEFKVDVAIPPEPHFLGDTTHVNVTASFLFDAPMANAAVQWRAQFKELQGAPKIPGLKDGWLIGRERSWWDYDEENASFTAAGAAMIGTDGRVRLSIPSDTVRFSPGATMQVDVAVTDLNQQVVSAQTTTALPGAAFYVAAKALGERYWWNGGTTQRVVVGAIRPEGEWLTGVTVHGMLVRRHWEAREDDDNQRLSWRWVSDTVTIDSVVTNDSLTELTFTPKSEGFHEVLLSATDGRGRSTTTSFGRYVFAGGRGVSWGDDPTKLPLFVQRDSLEVGDFATVRFTSPFDRAEAWITVEREGVLWQERRQVTAGATSLRIPVREAWIPNAYIGVVLVHVGDMTLRDSLPLRYRVGSMEVSVNDAPKRLTVTLRPSKHEFRPSDDAEIAVNVKDARGRPVVGDVILWAADEGVLSLTGFTTPQPMKEMYAPSAQDVVFSTTLTALARELQRWQLRGRLGEGPLRLEAVVATGAATADAKSFSVRGMTTADIFVNIRSLFVTTAFYRAGFSTDSTGVARVRVKLPDNLTTFRLMALAVGSDDKLGSGEGQLIVTKPLLVRAAMPRFVRPADEYTAGAIVNSRGQDGARRVQVGAVGEGIALTGDSLQTMTVGTSGYAAKFGWKARAGDQAVVRFGVTGGAEQDAVQVMLPVRPDQHTRAQTLVMLVGDSVEMRFALPKGIDAARSRLHIRVGATPLPVIRMYEQYLADYPHLCTEQLVSAGRAAIAL